MLERGAESGSCEDRDVGPRRDMAEILDGKEVKARLPIPLTVVTKANVETVEPAF